MSFGISVEGLASLRQRVNAMKQASSNLEPAYLRAGMVVLRAAKDHIKSGAGDQGPWAPNQTGTPLLFRTGRLINSLTINGPDSVTNLTSGGIEVGTNLPYAAWNQQGTGIYGARGTRIFPTTKKALAFNGFVVKSIAGTPPRRFLYIDDAQAQIIRGVFAAYILANPMPNEGT